MTITTAQSKPTTPAADDARSRADAVRQRENRDQDAANMPAKRSRRRFDDIF